MARGERNDQVAKAGSRGACRQDQSAIGGLGERRNIAFDLGGVPQIDRRHVHTQRRYDRLDHGELPDPLNDGRIAQNPDPRHVRRDFPEKLDPLRRS
jgi:hypothetical protein